jgi:aspartyl-tRNA(Asn)/glutamyl-tRNA(Gln) amidotransferase subunit C
MKREDIEHLAKLSRIELRPGEADALAQDITSILGYVSEINRITADASEEKKAGPLFNVMRKDGNPIEAGKYTEELLSLAPERDGNYVKVKKIIEK